MTTRRPKDLAHKRAVNRAAQKRWYKRHRDGRAVADVEYDEFILDKLVAANFLDDEKVSDVKEVSRAIERALRAIEP